MNIKRIINLSLLSVIILMLIPTDAYAQTGGVTLSTMFANFTGSANALIKLTRFVSYAIGIFLIVNAIIKMTQLGESNQMTIKTPLIMFFSGAAIFALTGAMAIATQTMAMGNGPGSVLLSAGSSGINGTSVAAINGVLVFIRLIGTIAFVRGWLMLNQAGQGKEGMIGRSLTHLFGGVAAINIKVTASILMATFAPGMSNPFL